ncbi:reticulocyte-binding protein 2 homolog a [Plakobranchus ocellatus]|uniref:Reticulocyte-binding protein 2 homolog a n=1 Tax=Plakobranchus ocellatus TaxID=259542 RepID=A0AAV4BBG1_9GAST|nr:reticulocyte-binding protein 2 homolog a [Plakobranchus ocellatus]
MSELDLYAKYLDLGVKLGRSGEDLTTWVEDKVRQDMERSDRQIERERKREEMEMQREEREMKKQREEKEMEMQRQREEMEMQKQREEIELQKHREEMAFRREEKEREMQKEESQRQLELRRMELEAETKKLEIGSRASIDVAGPKPSYGAQRPKIPPLHDPSQVDLYLERFERHASAFGWPESEWASCLSNLLQDEAIYFLVAESNRGLRLPSC